MRICGGIVGRVNEGGKETASKEELGLAVCVGELLMAWSR